MNERVQLHINDLECCYVNALDNKDMQAWLASFAKDGAYFAIPTENASRHLPLALMYDDCYARLEDRVTFVTKVWSGTFEDYQTRHFLQLKSMKPLVENLYEIVANVTVFYTEESGKSGLLAVGQYIDKVLIQNDQALFKEKKVLIDTALPPRYIVYPL